MPEYCGHIPTTKFLLSNKGGVPLSSHTQISILPYWARYNIDFKRQKEIKDFNMKHRENYKDKTGTVQPVNFFVMQ
ncbi:hypothetical protein PO909_010985 [Leuciscus waleckii]